MFGFSTPCDQPTGQCVTCSRAHNVGIGAQSDSRLDAAPAYASYHRLGIGTLGVLKPPPGYQFLASFDDSESTNNTTYNNKVTVFCKCAISVNCSGFALSLP